MAEYTYILKVVMAGRTRCGKSSLMARYCDGTFREDVSSTIGSGKIYLGVDFKIKLVTAHGQNHKLQIWDTSGVERFQSITASYYRGASTIILVFALNDRESFQLLDGYYRLAQMHNPDAKFAVIGNKSDAADRVISVDEIRNFAETRGMQYFETSAKDGSGVNNAMQRIAEAGVYKMLLANNRGHRVDELITRTEQLNQTATRAFRQQRIYRNTERYEFNRKPSEISRLEFYAPLLVLSFMLLLVAFGVI